MSSSFRELEIVQQDCVLERRRFRNWSIMGVRSEVSGYEWASKRCFIADFTPALKEALNMFDSAGWEIFSVVPLPPSFEEGRRNEDEALIIARRPKAVV